MSRPQGSWGARVGQGLKQACILLTHLVCSWLAARSKSLVMGEPSRSPGQPPGPRGCGPVLKEGWLKKQRSIMKNWQQRWFVLRGDQLFYYKDKDEAKPQVSGACSMSGTDRGGAPGRVDHSQERGRQRPSSWDLHPTSPQAPTFTQSDTPPGLTGCSSPSPRSGRHGRFTETASFSVLPLPTAACTAAGASPV